MIKFLMGVIIGILIFFFFIYFGGGKTVKKVGEGLTDSGKKMEVMEEIIKKEKHGFGLPIGIWIRTKDNISSFVRETLLNSNSTSRPFFRDGFIKELFKLHNDTGSAFYGDIIWLLLIFELWSKRSFSQ